MHERRRRGHAAPRGPELLDLGLGLGEARRARALLHDAVDIAHRRGDVVGRALDLDEQQAVAIGQAEIRPVPLDRLDGAPVQQLRGGREDAGGEEIVER